MTKPLRVVIAEDHYLFREGTRQLLESTGKVTVVASVGDEASLLDAVTRLEPDAVVVDIRMPPDHKTEGIDAARKIRAIHPQTGVVVLSQYANALYAFELFQDGTDGLAYLLKDRVGDLDELLRAVTVVTNGGSVIDPQVVERLFARGTTVARPGMSHLTEREGDVIKEMAQGQSNRRNSLHLRVSGRETHQRHPYQAPTRPRRLNRQSTRRRSAYIPPQLQPRHRRTALADHPPGCPHITHHASGIPSPGPTRDPAGRLLAGGVTSYEPAHHTVCDPSQSCPPNPPAP